MFKHCLNSAKQLSKYVYNLSANSPHYAQHLLNVCKKSVEITSECGSKTVTKHTSKSVQKMREICTKIYPKYV